jgi:hypothetical protein
MSDLKTVPPQTTEEEWQEAKRRTDAVARTVLPFGWREQPVQPRDPFYGGRSYFHRSGLHVLLSAGLWEDGRWWLVVAAPVLLIPTLLLAGCVLAVADEPWGAA